MSKLEILKPKQLQKGDTIAIISPSGSIPYPEKFERAKKHFEAEGYKVLIYPHARNKAGYLAGSDEERLSDLMEAFSNLDVTMILTSRGGYGATRYLDQINYDIICSNPKIFVGYSDITALHSAIFKNTGLVTFHGPFALQDFGGETVDEYTEKSFWNTISGNKEIENVFDYTPIYGGKTTGQLVGGNLTVLTCLIGTEFLPDFKGKILFLEDVQEPLYKLDRMLTQLRLSGVFDEIGGLLIGKFSDIGENQAEQEKLAIDLVKDLTQSLNIPVGYGFSASHLTQKATLPLNVEYEFNASSGELIVLEDFLS